MITRFLTQLTEQMVIAKVLYSLDVKSLDSEKDYYLPEFRLQLCHLPKWLSASISSFVEWSDTYHSKLL